VRTPGRGGARRDTGVRIRPCAWRVPDRAPPRPTRPAPAPLGHRILVSHCFSTLLEWTSMYESLENRRVKALRGSSLLPSAQPALPSPPAAAAPSRGKARDPNTGSTRRWAVSPLASRGNFHISCLAITIYRGRRDGRGSGRDGGFWRGRWEGVAGMSRGGGTSGAHDHSRQFHRVRPAHVCR
jgi:hypothetical protein